MPSSLVLVLMHFCQEKNFAYFYGIFLFSCVLLHSGYNVLAELNNTRVRPLAKIFSHEIFKRYKIQCHDTHALHELYMSVLSCVHVNKQVYNIQQTKKLSHCVIKRFSIQLQRLELLELLPLGTTFQRC